MGIMAALLERSTSGQGQIIDSNMVEGAAYAGETQLYTFFYFSKTRDIKVVHVLLHDILIRYFGMIHTRNLVL